MASLFEPLTIRGINIKNRVAAPPMVCYTFAGANGFVTPENVAHYRAIANGGAGLIIQEATCVTPDGRLSERQLGIWQDGHIAGLKEITDAVHSKGGVIFIQLHHAGILSVDTPRLCSSDFEAALPDGKTVKGHEMTQTDIQLIKRRFKEACIRAEAAGYDGAELHGCHSYLLCQFFNNQVNQRPDNYGKTPWLLALEILKEARAAVSDKFAIGIRLGGFEPSLAEGIANAKAMEQAGADFLNISYGFKARMRTEKPDGFPYSDIIYAAREIKASTNMPVFAVNGINSPETAENVLSLTGVDMVCIGRATLVNYNWANDAKNGKDTGSCLYCGQCMWRIDPEKCPGRLRYLNNR